MLLVIYVLMVGMNLGLSVAHVFCQDTHATDWTPLGYSCPINCAAVVAAVQRLKDIDYEELMTAPHSPFSPKTINMTAFEDDSTKGSQKEVASNTEKEETLTRSNITKRSRNEIAMKQLTPLHYMQLYKLLLNKRSGRELQKALKQAEKQLRNGLCHLFKERKGDKFELVEKCALRSVQEEFTKRFTKILNKHTSSDFFTEEMTARLLNKMLGDNAAIRPGVLNVHKIMSRLARALSSQKVRGRAAGHSVTLRSKYCLNVFVPGCFCMIGYVENNGQCVSPTDCFPADTVREYLARITVA